MADRNDNDRPAEDAALARLAQAGLGEAWPSLVEGLAQGVLLLGSGGGILYANREAQRLLQRSASELSRWPIEQPLRHGEPVEIDVRAPDGQSRVVELRPVPVEFSDGSGWVASLRDVTARVAAAARAAERPDRTDTDPATQFPARDALTGLANTAGLALALKRAATDGAAPGADLAAILIDLDGFRRINEVFGHDIGDRLLIRVAGCLRAALRTDDCIARVGGDAFVVLLQHCSTLGAATVAETLRRDIAATRLPLRETILEVTASLAVIAVGPAARQSTDRLLLDLRRCLDASREPGRNRVSIGTAQPADSGPAPPDSTSRLRRKD